MVADGCRKLGALKTPPILPDKSWIAFPIRIEPRSYFHSSNAAAQRDHGGHYAKQGATDVDSRAEGCDAETSGTCRGSGQRTG